MSKEKHTPGAMRAVERIADTENIDPVIEAAALGPDGRALLKHPVKIYFDSDAAAAIIEEETKCGKMLEQLEDIVEHNDSISLENRPAITVDQLDAIRALIAEIESPEKVNQD